MTPDATTSTLRSPDGTPIELVTIGQGPPVLVVGGALRTAADYLPFASKLGDRFTVHVVERRGHGASGPQGPDYSMERERDDLLAVQALTGARSVFGHSFGGLVALETAAAAPVFDRLALYEPAVSVEGSVPTGWIEHYSELLRAGRRRAAFAFFVQQSGHAPGPAARLPLWYLTTIMRLVVRGHRWQQFDALLEVSAAEHRQVAACDGHLRDYAGLDSPLLVLAGSRSPRFAAAELLRALSSVVPHATTELLDGLDHNAPDEKAPARVAAAVSTFFG